MINKLRYLDMWWVKKYNARRTFDFQTPIGKIEILVNFLDYYKIKYKLNFDDTRENIVSYLLSLLDGLTFYYSRYYDKDGRMVRFTGYSDNGCVRCLKIEDENSNIFRFKSLKKAIDRYKNILENFNKVNLNKFKLNQEII